MLKLNALDGFVAGDVNISCIRAYLEFRFNGNSVIVSRRRIVNRVDFALSFRLS